MFAEFKELLSIFNAKGVRYLVVGGYAVSLHAQPRTTQDIDFFIAADPQNAAHVYAALQEFGAPLEGLSPEDFAVAGKFFRMGRSPLAVDILPEIDGVNFETAWKNRTAVLVDEPSGLKALFISSEDLIANKLAAGRPQDLADVAALRDAAKKNE